MDSIATDELDLLFDMLYIESGLALYYASAQARMALAGDDLAAIEREREAAERPQ